MGKDYRIVAKVKNNRILSLIEASGARSVCEFCRTNGVNYQAVVSLISMRGSPLSRRGRWAKVALDLAAALKVQPDELFNGRQLRGGNSCVISREVDETALEHVAASDRLLPSPEGGVIAAVDVERLMRDLDPRAKRIVSMKFGLEGQGEATLHEIGDEIGITSERVRQILARSFRKMRHPARAEGYL